VRYSLLLTGNGGIIDDLMVTNAGEYLYLVVNGATKWDDLAHMRSELPDSITINHMEDSALLALQGPEAAAVLAGMIPAVADLAFMEAGAFEWEGHDLWISRSGYTGEDGFEISIPAASAQAFADALVADARVKPIGLGARDSLRLEAGLPLYGHDLDTEITPVMADLGFAIGKRRRSDGGFAGAGRIGAELESGPVQKRIGIEVDGRQPVREGARILDEEGNEVGKVTSGGFSPTLQRPIAMGYVAEHLAEPGTGLKLEQRSKLFEGRVTAMPFVPHRYHRKGAAK
jgi:aminomethyltransferase